MPLRALKIKLTDVVLLGRAGVRSALAGDDVIPLLFEIALLPIPRDAFAEGL